MSIYISRQMLKSDSHQQKVAERPGILYRLSRSVLRKWRRRRLIAALEAFDERLLRDIGIERGDIKRVVDRFDDKELRMVPLAPAPVTSQIEGEAYTQAA